MSLHLLLHRHVFRGVRRREHVVLRRAHLRRVALLLLLLPRLLLLLLLLPGLRLPRRRLLLLLVVLLLGRLLLLLVLLLLMLAGDDPVLQLEHLRPQPLELHHPRLPPNLQLQLQHLLEVRLVQLLDVLVVGNLLGQLGHLVHVALTPAPAAAAAARRRLLHRDEHVPELLLEFLHLPSQTRRVIRRLRPSTVGTAPTAPVVPAAHHTVRVHRVTVHAVRSAAVHPRMVATVGRVTAVRGRVTGVAAAAAGAHRPWRVPPGRAPRPVGRVIAPRGLVHVVVVIPFTVVVSVVVAVVVSAPVCVVPFPVPVVGMLHVGALADGVAALMPQRWYVGRAAA